MSQTNSPFKSSRLLLLGIIGAMVFMAGQKNTSVTAKEPITVAPEQITDHPVKPLHTAIMQLGGQRYKVEIASTQEEIQRGLMFRTRLPDNHGMLFPFTPPRRVNFWMKNTKIPLDMIFLREHKIVHIVHAAQPCIEDPCPLYPSVVPVDMVVELPAGTAAANDFRYGDPVVFLSDESDRKAEITPKSVPASSL